MKQLKVLVVVHETLVPPADVSGLTEDQMSEWRTEYDVIRTLRQAGHEVRLSSTPNTRTSCPA